MGIPVISEAIALGLRSSFKPKQCLNLLFVSASYLDVRRVVVVAKCLELLAREVALLPEVGLITPPQLMIMRLTAVSPRRANPKCWPS